MFFQRLTSVDVVSVCLASAGLLARDADFADATELAGLGELWGLATTRGEAVCGGVSWICVIADKDVFPQT